MDEDWGFSYRERLFAAPYITLVDVDAAVAELEWALARDARCVVMRAAPVVTPRGSASPADPRFDPFWARVNEAGITVAYHSGDSGYLKFAQAWGVGGDFKSFDFNPVRLCLSPQPVADLLAALICGGLLDRHRNLRIATIETGSSWVPGLLKRFKKAHGQMPFAFQQDPVEAFRRHVWVSPYYEDPLEELRDQIGADHMLFGSDFPHGEGLANPVEFVKDLDGFSAKEIRLVMRENGLGLIRPARV
jgi:predicted TIM-barrel fold metal-dependent hydrolase